MKEDLDRYVRSLAEQEQDARAPERSQDLGTFVVWLLERRGFTIHLRSFRYEGAERRKNSGLTQLGVDIIASRRLRDGRRCLYLFVLKQGNITLEMAGGARGTIFHDIELASQRPATSDAWFDLEGRAFDVRTVIAVHNGDLDERLVGMVDEKRAHFRRHRDVRLRWWDAAKLVKYAMLPPRDTATPGLARGADASLFPPGVRPFARAALDSVAHNRGHSFDLGAVDRLLDEVLPVGRAPVGTGPGSGLGPGKALKARELRRRLAEMTLFTQMVAIECRRVAASISLPVLDTIERVICRVMEHVRRIPREEIGGHRGKIRTLLRRLLGQYVAQTQCLCRHLEPLLQTPYGLALGAPSERIDYPLRALRLSGYLAVAGLALLDVKKPRSAQRLARTLENLWTNNVPACTSPVTDDQIIEISLVFEFWRRCGMEALSVQMAMSTAQRLRWMKDLGLPLPALYQHARVPPDDEDLHVLAETHLRGWLEAPPAFNDHGSTILPLVLYLAHRRGGSVDASDVASFTPPAPGDLQTEAGSPGAKVSAEASVPGRPERLVYLQSWRPPEDAADEWYVQEIRHRGMVKVFELTHGLEAMAKEFESFNRPLPQSPAESWKLPVIDRIAWKCWRTPPPMAIFCEGVPPS